jgi:uncharacterized pyridoxamine 5'-phosphate oxidase family protein
MKLKKEDAWELPKKLFERITNGCYRQTSTGKIFPLEINAVVWFVCEEKSFKLCAKVNSANNIVLEISAINQYPWLKIEENIFMPTDDLFIAAILTVWQEYAELLSKNKNLKTQQAELGFDEAIRRAGLWHK